VEKDFWIWTAALESGFLPLTELERWADNQILQLDRPPLWMLDLPASRSEQDACEILWQAWRNHVEATNTGDFPRHHAWGQLYLGFLYLRFECGDLAMARMLRLAGDMTDRHNCGINCEAYYLLLNEIDGGGPTIPGDRSLRERVAERFEPFAALARRHQRSLQVIPQREARAATGE
jgi:hypothetical protein